MIYAKLLDIYRKKALIYSFLIIEACDEPALKAFDLKTHVFIIRPPAAVNCNVIFEIYEEASRAILDKYVYSNTKANTPEFSFNFNMPLLKSKRYKINYTISKNFPSKFVLPSQQNTFDQVFELDSSLGGEYIALIVIACIIIMTVPIMVFIFVKRKQLKKKNSYIK